MPRHPLFLLLALLPACAQRAAPLPDLVPFATPGIEHAARAGAIVLGGQPSPAALRRLADSGFRTIVSTRAATELDWDEEAAVEALGMRFVRIPIPLPLTPVTPEQVEALDRVLAAERGPVFLHCAAGIRAAVLWAVWRREAHAVDPAATLRQVEEAGLPLSPGAVRRLLGGTEPRP